MTAKTRTPGRRATVKTAAGAKIDLRKSPLYRATAGHVDFVTIPAARYLMIDGEGDPNGSPAFQEAVQALYAMSYTLRSLVRRDGGQDFAVMPLEGLWWTEDARPLLDGDKAGWKWTLMIAQPDAVTPTRFVEARKTIEGKGIGAAARIRLTRLREGRAAQMLHVGPYATEGPTIERVLRAIAEKGGAPAGRHHEIYLGDPRRSAPGKLRTIVRQPYA